MIFKYTIACLIIFAILIFLKFVEDSPVRSWKAALLSACGLSAVVCWYLHWAMPKPLPPAPMVQKVANYKAALERNFSHMAGVDRATIEGNNVRINFTEEKSNQELKRIAEESSGMAFYTLKDTPMTQLTFILSVRGEERCQIVIDARRGVIKSDD